MNKTIYVRDEDVATWEKAKDLAGDKLSPIIAAALRRFVAQQEAAAQGFARLELEYPDANSGGLPRRKAFFGRWIFPPEKPHSASGENEKGYSCILAITAKGAVVTCSWWYDEETVSYKKFRVYVSFEEAARDSEVSWAIIAARHKIGVPVEELDI